ncbi:MAG: PD-(D/E)XK nuclease family protein [Paludibacter sp.]|nr:PD-(D/E)XK nuclease family protein [Paludibacter sp.]
MNSFLYRIASTYYSEEKESVSDFTFVFPNRRAGLFFQRYLSEIAQKPLFSPEILTINDCFDLASKWQTSDRLSNLFKLYKIYKELSGSDETFDSFVYWGEMLLSDFEDVDKYMVDAKQLFTNVTELKQIDQLFNIFSEKQIEAIRQFWSNFVPVTEGKSQEDFIATWKILLPVYEQFRAELISENSATEGMICRDIAERLKAKDEIEEYSGKQFVFIGFNALNPCERTLMAEMQKRNQADFYWDYEALELRDSDNQASFFFAENTHSFPSRFKINPVIESLHDKNIELISVPSAVGQTKQIHSILNQLFSTENKIETSNEKRAKTNWINTAIVLPDEGLLVPLLHSIPEQIEKINVTMGFPLKSTPVSGLIEHIFELQKRMRISGDKISFYHQTVSNILNHQYIAFLCADEANRLTRELAENNWIYIDANELCKNPLLSSIFIPQTETRTFLTYLLQILRSLQNGWQSASDETHDFRLECDFLYQYYITLNRMSDIMVSNPENPDINLDTLMRLTRQLIAGITIPFVGEPLDGLQIMGVLETRGLDFDNLIITSFNEGIFPQKSATNSFIPFNLRKGFELPTTEHQDAITAYNFYRLIHRAKRIFFISDSRTEGTQTGEVSRFMHQLYYHYGVKVIKKTVSFDIGFNNAQAIQVEKTPAIMKKLHRFTAESDAGFSLSASSLNTYIDCPLQFYLTKVEIVEQAEEVLETVESNMFGTLFHKVMENLYFPFKGKMMQTEDFDGLIKNTLQIDNEIVKAFSKEYFKKKNNAIVQLEGNNLLIASVLRKYILQVLKVDKSNAPFRYISSEERCNMQLPINNGELSVNLKGFIDRIDEKEGKLRILDYKTGTGKLDFKNLEEVFEHNKENRPKFVLQTFLYCELYEFTTKRTNTIPGIYYIRDIFKDEFNTELTNKELKEKVLDFADYKEDFNLHLVSCLEEIFNPEIPFVQTENTKICQYCPYTAVCNR